MTLLFRCSSSWCSTLPAREAEVARVEMAREMVVDRVSVAVAREMVVDRMAVAREMEVDRVSVAREMLVDRMAVAREMEVASGAAREKARCQMNQNYSLEALSQ